MDQGPSSKIVDELAQAPVNASSSDDRPDNNSHTAINLSTRKNQSGNSCLPPPPSYYSTHLQDFSFLKSDPFFLSKWSVNVKRIKSELNDTFLVIELNGTLLENDRQTISKENHDAGRLNFLLSKNVVKTTNGVYHLIGPIIEGFPNNLYRACLETNGIPKTWKYILTQFSSKLPSYNQSTTSTAQTLANTHNIALPDLVRNVHLLRRLLFITNRKVRELNTARKPVSFVRYQFNQKLIYSCGVINNQIMTCLTSKMNNV